MSQPVVKVPLKESNNHSQGKSGSGTKMLSGPAKNPKQNPTKGGGIYRKPNG